MCENNFYENPLAVFFLYRVDHFLCVNTNVFVRVTIKSLVTITPNEIKEKVRNNVLLSSGTTGEPKGVQHPTGGHAVVNKWTMETIYGMKPGDTW